MLSFLFIITWSSHNVNNCYKLVIILYTETRLKANSKTYAIDKIREMCYNKIVFFIFGGLN